VKLISTLNSYAAVETTLIVRECPTCGITYALPQKWEDSQRRLKGTVYCPAGCRLGWNKSEADRLRAQLDQAKANAAYQRNRREAAEAEAERAAARARGYKGALVKAKKRAAAGVCPVAGCKRTFADVARHVANQHPDWQEEGE
jgi:hypothetical protein